MHNSTDSKFSKQFDCVYFVCGHVISSNTLATIITLSIFQRENLLSDININILMVSQTKTKNEVNACECVLTSSVTFGSSFSHIEQMYFCSDEYCLGKRYVRILKHIFSKREENGISKTILFFCLLEPKNQIKCNLITFYVKNSSDIIICNGSNFNIEHTHTLIEDTFTLSLCIFMDICVFLFEILHQRMSVHQFRFHYCHYRHCITNVSLS